MEGTELDAVLAKLAKDVETAVHALYRGDVRQGTMRGRSGAALREAQAAMKAAVVRAGVSLGTPAAGTAAVPPRPSATAPVVAGASVGWSKEEGEAVTKCITAWLPMGNPRDAAPDSKCISAASMLAPTWAQRERAREAVKRLSSPT